MKSAEELENNIVRMDNDEVIAYLRSENLLNKEMNCVVCNQFLSHEKSGSFVDKYCWRCYNPNCLKYRARTSIRQHSFFEGLKIEFFAVIKTIIAFASDQARFSLVKKGTVTFHVYDKIYQRILALIKEDNSTQAKFGGPGMFIQVDETMLNFKCKSHRGRSPTNKTDALCIVEVNKKITRAYGVTIPNKEAKTLIPIICEKVVNGSTIYTDEHKSYSSLSKNGFFHKTVCHKYNFVDKVTGAHTQFVESFNNALKLEIKRRKGIETDLRDDFLAEFTWKFNNKESRYEKILALIKNRY